MSAPVFVCPAAADAVVGSVLEVAGDEARHAVKVQRRQVGEIVDLVDGSGARARGGIVAVGDAVMTVQVSDVSRDVDGPVVLVQALAKNGRDEQAIEASTELGATRIIPWSADRCIVQWRGDKVAKGRDRWQSLATAAAKQSRRAVIPDVDALVTTKQLVVLVREAAQQDIRVLVLHEIAAVPVVDLPWESKEQTPVWVIVGPEGGITESEVDALVEAGAEAVVLGPHVLRASSAGPAAIAAIAALRGSWSSRQ